MTKIRSKSNPFFTKILLSIGLSFLILGVLSYFGALPVVLASPKEMIVEQRSPIHPTFELLDDVGKNVLETGKPISTMQTCGNCHDTEFIANHSFHASAGLDSLAQPGQFIEVRSWDISNGLFGRWDPLTYRYLNPVGDTKIDLTTPDWVRTIGLRHVGGGPAVNSRNGEKLTELVPSTDNPESSAVDPNTGQLIPWDWQESGIAEMNCFLCHTPTPNNIARTEAIINGDFAWASSATLIGTGIIVDEIENYSYNPDAFDENGEITREIIQIQDPTNENCGICHGLVHTKTEEPLVAASCSSGDLRTDTTGQIISPQRIMDSGINLVDKDSLTRSWDIHAERVVNCTDCHFSLNNPIYFQEEGSRPDHLSFDPRRLDLGEYLYQPVHDFARGESAQSVVAPELKETMRECESCHDIEKTHTWLPYKDRHIEEMSCETCHIPQVYYSALEQVDWTVVKPDASPVINYRGTEACDDTLIAINEDNKSNTFLTSTLGANLGQSNKLVTGYTPVLLPKQDSTGNTQLAPYNLVTAWYWVSGDPPIPVSKQDLILAWMEGDNFAPDVVNLFDINGDGRLSAEELTLDSKEKESLITDRLTSLGLDDPRIQADIQPYSINHTVTHGEWATQDCQSCHSKASRLTEPIQLAAYTPGGVLPEFVDGNNVVINGEIIQAEDGSLYYQPNTVASGLYIFGKNSVGWIDLFGSLAFIGVLFAITIHGGFRFYSALRSPHDTPQTKQVYMYSVYERFWHWLQTFTIILLLFTGLIIHRPDTFGIFSFKYVVQVHNILAVILLINAGLSLFYHLASGEIKQYIPRVGGFFDQAIEQAVFYTRGIFSGKPHPFEKTPQKKLNPLQQITYFGILNVLLPLQIITGILMWGVQQFPVAANALGGLPYLAPFHTIIAWLFAAFIVAHVYLTTTGHEPTAAVKAMMTGWDEVEILDSKEEDSDNDNFDGNKTKDQ